jgi:hypothetical protein
MARDYAAEYRASQYRAQARGFRTEYQERQEKRRLDATRLHPSMEPRVITPWDRPVDRGMQGPFGPSPDWDPSTNTPDWDYYWPTRSSMPSRPATIQARYSARTKELQVVFRDGTPWTYTDINQGFWTAFKRTGSPGKLLYSIWPGFPVCSYLNGLVPNQQPGGWGNILPQPHESASSQE